MSTLSEYLNEHLPAGWQKPQLVEALSGTLDRATVYRYLAGSHPRSPAESVLEAFAAVLPGVSVVELRAAANLSTGAEEPWVPPVEANRLNYAQRRALETFIKATVGPVDDTDEPADHESVDPGPADAQPPLAVRPSAPALTEQERAEVGSYIRRLRASGRKDLADRVAASLAANPAVEASEVARRPADA
ncbi:MAG TPA: hypothetical protein VGB75_04835 [Jatrophihabitans sp.]|uniref:hypothetical protein n=1 Tax=Jatrophihabitans sp. TaxID=1932789 RepID=UPI002EE62C02